MATKRSDYVRMHNPEAKAPAVEVPKKAFDRHWSKKGWVEVESVDVPVDQPLSSLSRADLDALAVERGLNPSDFTNKGELVAALES